MIDVPCVFFMPFIVIVVRIPLLVAYETMYVIIVVEVSIGVVVVHVVVVKNVVGMQVISQGAFGIPTIV